MTSFSNGQAHPPESHAVEQDGGANGQNLEQHVLQTGLRNYVGSHRMGMAIVTVMTMIIGMRI
jgi:hypothetical protein